jgi:hypothetical protein
MQVELIIYLNFLPYMLLISIHKYILAILFEKDRFDELPRWSLHVYPLWLLECELNCLFFTFYIPLDNESKI